MIFATGRQLALVRVAERSLRKHYNLQASYLEQNLQPYPAGQATMSSPSSPHYEAPLACFPRDVTLSIDLQGSHFVIDEFLHDDAEATQATSEAKQQKYHAQTLEQNLTGLPWEKLISDLDLKTVESLAKEEAERLRKKRHSRARGTANFEGCQDVRRLSSANQSLVSFGPQRFSLNLLLP